MDIQEVTIDDDYDDGSDDGENEFDYLNSSTPIQPISRKELQFIQSCKQHPNHKKYDNTILRSKLHNHIENGFEFNSVRLPLLLFGFPCVIVCVTPVHQLVTEITIQRAPTF